MGPESIMEGPERVGSVCVLFLCIYVCVGRRLDVVLLYGLARSSHFLSQIQGHPLLAVYKPAFVCSSHKLLP